MNQEKLPVLRWLTPMRQFLLIVIASILAMAFGKMAGSKGEIEWLVADVGILFFALVNPVLSIFIHKKKWRYFLFSVLFFLASIITLMVAAKLISIEPLNTFSEYRLILGVTVVFFFLANGLATIIKLVIELTEPEAF
jgi:hypothetical protein